MICPREEQTLKRTHMSGEHGPVSSSKWTEWCTWHDKVAVGNRMWSLWQCRRVHNALYCIEAAFELEYLATLKYFGRYSLTRLRMYAELLTGIGIGHGSELAASVMVRVDSSKTR